MNFELKVRAELKEMNEAFKEELADMEANERTARELEECYFSDEEDLVVNPAARNRKSSQVRIYSTVSIQTGESV